MTNMMRLVAKPEPPEPAGLKSYKSRGERLTQHAQTKLTPSEAARVAAFVDYCTEHGIDIRTPAAALRYFTVTALDAFEAEQAVLTGQ
jgi:hypothetical protein